MQLFHRAINRKRTNKTNLKLKADQSLKGKLKGIIKKHAESFPLGAQFYEIKIDEIMNSEESPLTFGKFGSKLLTSQPFYKPFSKIVKFDNLTEYSK